MFDPKAKIEAGWRRLQEIEKTPHEIAFGLALGVFVSFFPIIPFQTVAALALALLFRGNKISCLIGLHLHDLLFPLIPLMFVAEYEVGRMGHPLGLHPKFTGEHWTFAELAQHGGPVFRTMLLGALILATPAALAAYLIGRSTARDWQTRRSERKARGE
ncbi:MAG: DUF2062 domain-containing protein [Verrucomicrobiae bacterium]|nr:DUF2062 domain-containing protein [Verrucomicrobiae bacterium]